jgi:hypothetical protein
MANTINHTESLKDYLKVQLEETYDRILWAQQENHPSSKERIDTLLFRKAWLLQQLNNTYFKQA